MKMQAMLIAAVAAALSTAAMADSPTRGRGQAGGPQARAGFHPRVLWQRLDKNKDDVVTADEVPAGAPDRLKALLARADANGDKKLTKKEARAAVARAMKARRGGRPGAACSGKRGRCAMAGKTRGPGKWRSLAARPGDGGFTVRRPMAHRAQIAGFAKMRGYGGHPGFRRGPSLGRCGIHGPRAAMMRRAMMRRAMMMRQIATAHRGGCGRPAWGIGGFGPHARGFARGFQGFAPGFRGFGPAARGYGFGRPGFGCPHCRHGQEPAFGGRGLGPAPRARMAAAHGKSHDWRRRMDGPGDRARFHARPGGPSASPHGPARGAEMFKAADRRAA